MNSGRRTTSRGFTMTEMLVILGLLGVAGLLASRLFTASMKVISAAPAAQDQQASFERMIHVLRDDVWAAQKIVVIDGHAIEIDAIKWRFADTTVVRTSHEGERSWNLRRPIEASVDGAALVLSITGHAPDELRLISQIRTNGGSNP